MDLTLIILGVIALIIIWVIALYNGLIQLKNRTEEAWADIDVQLKRRFDLIPNLIETVKGYATHEQSTFDKVIQARNAAMSAMSGGDIKKTAETENAFSSTIKSMFALAESYPDLKANQNFLELQRELADTEDKIQASRRFYNGNVRDLNTKIETFPTNMLANTLGFKKREFFEIDNPAEKETVKVKF